MVSMVGMSDIGGWVGRLWVGWVGRERGGGG